MKRFLTLLITFSLVFCSTFLTACDDSDDKTAQVLKVCNCEDYIDESLLDAFTEETGIEVVYSTFSTNENLYNELVINPKSYDLVVPSEYMIEKLAVEGRIQPLNNQNYKNLLSDYNENVSPFIKERLQNIKINGGEYQNQSYTLYDFMVGYMWGTMGWVYNVDKVSIDDVRNWGNIFNNATLNRRSTLKDSVRDSYLVGLAMVYKDELLSATDNATISEILNRTDKRSIELVGEKLSSLKNQLYGFEVDSGKNDIVLGVIDAYVAWSGDAAYAIDVATGEVENDDGSFVSEENLRNLSYYIPDEGSNIWFDGFCMPSGSTNYEAVYKFLEFISRPSSVYDNMNYTGYTGMVSGGEFEAEDEDGNAYTTTLFDEVVLGWFDETESLLEDAEIDDLSLLSSSEIEELGYKEVDLSYFFGEGDYSLIVSNDYYGRFLSQYPTSEIVERCAVMSYFDSNTLMDINEMWEGVKGETWPWWVIITFFAVIVLFGALVLLYRNKEKIKWFKLPESKKSYAEKHNLKEISRREIKI